jgi:hypothetical protein
LIVISHYVYGQREIMTNSGDPLAQ